MELYFVISMKHWQMMRHHKAEGKGKRRENNMKSKMKRQSGVNNYETKAGSSDNIYGAEQYGRKGRGKKGSCSKDGYGI